MDENKLIINDSRSIIDDAVDIALCELLLRISIDYHHKNINYYELITKYKPIFKSEFLYNKMFNLPELLLPIDSINKNTDKCIAITSKGIKCSRKKILNSEFCKTHVKSSVL